MPQARRISSIIAASRARRNRSYSAAVRVVDLVRGRSVADLAVGFVRDHGSVRDGGHACAPGDAMTLQIGLWEHVMVLKVLELDVLAATPISCATEGEQTEHPVSR